MDLTIKEKVKIIGFGLLFLGFIGIIANEISWLQNTLAAKKLVGIFAVIGLGIGIFLANRFAQKTEDGVEKMRWYVMFTLLCTIIMPFVGSLTNRVFAFHSYEKRTVELFEQKGFIAGLGIMKGESMEADGYFSFVIIEGKLERLKSRKPMFLNAKVGEEVAIFMKKGLYGFWVVKTK